ncbi:Uncharacterised protein [Shigella sonnei]|nr:Uncharacterised protein [Shigella sonnei]
MQFLPDSLTRRCDIISGGCVGDCLVPVVKKNVTVYCATFGITGINDFFNFHGAFLTMCE